MGPSVLFLQNSTHRAGAQTSLARLLGHEAMRKWNPVLVCSRGGWLVSETARLGVATIEEGFPRSRSVPARLYGNAAFARRVCRDLKVRSLLPAIIHANDHQEGLLGLEIARRIGARTVIFLRSSALRRDDYFKYRCDEYDLVFAVGDELAARVRTWTPRAVELHYDGIAAEDFSPPKFGGARVPDRALVIGSSQELKGWADLTGALYLLEQEGALPPMQFDFTDMEPDSAENDLKIHRLKSARCNFLGRVEAFRELVRGYDLVINPSRMETFGLAAIEVLAAGIPLLSSRTGVVEQVQENSRLLFRSSAPDALAAALRDVLEHWSEIDFGVARAQALIHERFLIDKAAAQLDAYYSRLLAART